MLPDLTAEQILIFQLLEEHDGLNALTASNIAGRLAMPIKEVNGLCSSPYVVRWRTYERCPHKAAAGRWPYRHGEPVMCLLKAGREVLHATR